MFGLENALSCAKRKLIHPCERHQRNTWAVMYGLKGSQMSTLGFVHSDVESPHATPRSVEFLSGRFAEIYSGPLKMLSAGEDLARGQGVDGVYVSHAKALRCAKGALMALGLEAAAAVVALCIYGALQL